MHKQKHSITSPRAQNISKNKNYLYSEIKRLISQAQSFAVQNVNTILVFTNYCIGKMIVENEQQGKHRAKYSEKTLENLSSKLIKDFGNGYSKRNLDLMKQFYLAYGSQIVQTLSAQSEVQSGIVQTLSAQLSAPKQALKRKSLIIQAPSINELFTWQKSLSEFQLHFSLSWSHYSFLLRIKNEDERRFYEIESSQNNWSIRELQRQFNSSLFERLALSKNKKAVKALSKKGQIITKPTDVLKEPYILEFLNMKDDKIYSETELEQAIISKIESFLMELGKGFLFQNRQQRISFEGDNFYIDLVFYNRLLKCFVLIDLKIGELKHQDIGQMQMYVNYFDRKIKTKDENKTIGVVLCKQTNKAVVEYTLPKENEQIYAREYKLYLPGKRQLQKLIEG